MEEEIWRDIPGYEGYYQCSNMGRVKSLYRLCKNKFGIIYPIKERILRQVNGSNGYKIVNLSKNGITCIFGIHQIVAITFLDHVIGDPLLSVDHIDNNKLNNNLNNIQVISKRLNSSKDIDKSKTTSKYIGVRKVSYKNKTKQDYIKYTSSIQNNGIIEHLGTYNNEIDAADAYKNRLLEIIDKQIPIMDGYGIYKNKE